MNTNLNENIQRYNSITAFCTEHTSLLGSHTRVRKWLSHFNVKVSAIMVIKQHMLIATKGSEDFLHNIKEPLAMLAANIAQLMKILSGKKSGWWRSLPDAKELLAHEENAFMEECLLVYNTANKMMVVLEKEGLTLQMVNTLKTAIDVYNAVIPAPKAAKIVEQHYQQTINLLIKETEDLLKIELDPAVIEATKKKPELQKEYIRLRGIKGK